MMLRRVLFYSIQFLFLIKTLNFIKVFLKLLILFQGYKWIIYCSAVNSLQGKTTSADRFSATEESRRLHRHRCGTDCPKCRPNSVQLSRAVSALAGVRRSSLSLENASENLRFTGTPDVISTSGLFTCHAYGKTPSFCFLSPVWDGQVNRSTFKSSLNSSSYLCPGATDFVLLIWLFGDIQDGWEKISVSHEN